MSVRCRVNCGDPSGFRQQWKLFTKNALSFNVDCVQTFTNPGIDEPFHAVRGKKYFYKYNAAKLYVPLTRLLFMKNITFIIEKVVAKLRPPYFGTLDVAETGPEVRVEAVVMDGARQ